MICVVCLIVDVFQILFLLSRRTFYSISGFDGYVNSTDLNVVFTKWHIAHYCQILICWHKYVFCFRIKITRFFASFVLWDGSIERITCWNERKHFCLIKRSCFMSYKYFRSQTVMCCWKMCGRGNPGSQVLLILPDWEREREKEGGVQGASKGFWEIGMFLSFSLAKASPRKLFGSTYWHQFLELQMI